MTVTELHRTLELHADSAADDLADELYAAVRDAINQGQERAELYGILTSLYEDLKQRGLTKERRAVGEVIRCFDGYITPEAAL